MSQLEATDDEHLEALEYSPEEVRRLIMEELSVGPIIAGLVFGVGTSSAYRAARDGTFPSTRVGSKYAIPTSWIRQKLGLEPAAPTVVQLVPLAPAPLEPSKQVAPLRHKRRRRSR